MILNRLEILKSDFIQTINEDINNNSNIYSISSNNRLVYYNIFLSENKDNNVNSNTNNIYNLQCILLKNYYTALIDIDVLYNSNWNRILSNFKMMEDTQFEDDSERYVIISKDKFDFKFIEEYMIEHNLNVFDKDLLIKEYNKIKQIKIILHQPCKDYKLFKLNDIVFFNNLCNTEYTNIYVNKQITMSDNTVMIINENEIVDIYYEILKKYNNTDNESSTKDNKIKINVCY